MKKKIIDNWGYCVVIAVILAAAVYVLMNGENIYIPVHDNLDSNVVWLKILSDNHLFWKLDTTVPFLGGINRNYLYSDLKVYTWIYMIFPVFIAYVVGWFGKIMIAVSGFVFLGKIIYANFNSHRNAIILCGLMYGILPTFPTSAFAFASLPFLLGLMVLFYKKFSWKYLILLFLYPALSDFSLFGIFIFGYILIFFLIEWIVTKKPKWHLLAAFIALAVGYAVTEWRLFYIMLFSGEVTIRSTMASTYLSFPEVIKSILQVFSKGHYHSGSLHVYIVLPACFLYFLALNMKYIKRGAWKKCFVDYYNWLMVLLGFNAIVYGIDQYKPFKDLMAILVPPLTGFSFARTLWFNPFLWYFSFMVILCRIPKDWLKNLLCFLALGIVCLGGGTYNHVSQNLRGAASEVLNKDYDMLTYGEFYSEELFGIIKKELGYDGEWSIAYGMHPAVLEYNGIATLDGYLSYYSQDYKEKFRQLIAPALGIDEAHASYFDNWGGRAYIFSNEVSYDPVKEMEVGSAVLNIDPDIFVQMGGKYIFSRVEVSNAVELGMKEIGIYTADNSPYTIYVYMAVLK